MEEETRDATLVADKGPLPGDDQVRAFYDLMRATSARATCWPCPATLQLPDPYIYNRIIDLLADKGVNVFLDASGPSLVACIQRSPYLPSPTSTNWGNCSAGSS